MSRIILNTSAIFFFFFQRDISRGIFFNGTEKRQVDWRKDYTWICAFRVAEKSGSRLYYLRGSLMSRTPKILYHIHLIAFGAIYVDFLTLSRTFIVWMIDERINLFQYILNVVVLMNE